MRVLTNGVGVNDHGDMTKTHYVELDALRYYILDQTDWGWWTVYLSDFDGTQREIGDGRTLKDAREMAAEHRDHLLSSVK